MLWCNGGMIKSLTNVFLNNPSHKFTQLVEVFKDYEIIVPSRLKEGKYTRLYKIVKKNNPKKITLEDLKNFVKKLNERYPEEGFCLIKQKDLYIITKNNEHRKLNFVPIYFDLKNQKIFIEKEYAEKEKRLTNYILMRTLGALGISQSKYIGSEKVET
ncbi:MAG: hypothetical protein QXP52_00140 [Candidatus Aenigmatarchaeota archaeon]